jgi:hypothetical protein
MNQSQTLPQEQDSERLINNIKIAITVVYDRLEAEISTDKLNKITADVYSEFKILDSDLIVTALRNGSLGKYGKTYKLNVQEICIWIREHLKSDEVHSTLTLTQKKQFPKPKPKEDKL